MFSGLCRHNGLSGGILAAVSHPKILFPHQRIRSAKRRASSSIQKLSRIRIRALEQLAPFRRRIAEPRDTNATRQTTFDRGFDEIRCKERERDGHIDLTHATFFSIAICSTLVTEPETISSSQRRPRAIALTRRARRSIRVGRTSFRDASGMRICRDFLDGGFCQGIDSNCLSVD